MGAERPSGGKWAKGPLPPAIMGVHRLNSSNPRARLVGRYSMSRLSDELFSSGSVSFVLFPRTLDLRDKWS